MFVCRMVHTVSRASSVAGVECWCWLDGGLWDHSQPASQPVVTSTRGFGATASKVSVVDRPGVLPRLSSIGNLTGVNTGYYCVSICNYLSLTLNSYFHHNQTRPRTKNYKNTKWIFDWINHRPAEFTSILGNDKNLKEDLILRSKNYKIIFEIQSGEPSPDWVVLSGSGSRAALMIETFLSRSIAFLQHWGESRWRWWGSAVQNISEN